MWDSVLQWETACGINRSRTPLDVSITILLWHHIFPYFEINSNFLWKHINFMFFEKLWEKNNPSWVNPCGIRKSHPRGLIFLSGTQQASSLTKIFTPRMRFPLSSMAIHVLWWILLISYSYGTCVFWLISL